jgi:hypothetical protein
LNCYLETARLYGMPELCDKTGNVNDAHICTALYHLDSKYCKHITNNQKKTDECYSKIAKETQDIELCRLIRGPATASDCFKQFKE